LGGGSRKSGAIALFHVTTLDIGRLGTRFPYLVIFREARSGAYVIAVFHTSRDPRIWRQRAFAAPPPQRLKLLSKHCSYKRNRFCVSTRFVGPIHEHFNEVAKAAQPFGLLGDLSSRYSCRRNGPSVATNANV
jgi:hypothetical protein